MNEAFFAFAVRAIFIGAWFLVLSGIVQVIVYLLGEFHPSLYVRIRSDSIRRLLTGMGNRLIFGLGGLVTLLLGLFFIVAGIGLGWLHDSLPR